jgi:nucleoside-diphosphate-sugar epimerase
MRVLLTGGSGFIGRTCQLALAERQVELHLVCRSRPPTVVAGAIVHEMDLFDSVRTEALLADVRPTHLVHVAWVTTPGEYWTSPLNLRWLAASAELLRAFVAHGGRRAVIAGTCAEYDWSRPGVCDETTTPVAPATLYGTCKDALRRAAERFAETAGFSAAWGRIFFPYGPGESPRRLVASVARSLLAGQPARCTAGTQVRDFVHVRDVGGALTALLLSDVRGAVNIGSGSPVTLADVVRGIANVVGRPDLVELGALPTPATEPPVLVAGTRRLFDEVGWRPSVPLVEGLADSVAWWRTADR